MIMLGAILPAGQVAGRVAGRRSEPSLAPSRAMSEEEPQSVQGLERWVAVFVARKAETDFTDKNTIGAWAVVIANSASYG